MDGDPIADSVALALQRSAARGIRLKGRSGESGPSFGGFGHVISGPTIARRVTAILVRDGPSVEARPVDTKYEVVLPESDRPRKLSPEEKRDKRSKRLARRKAQRRNRKRKK